VGCPFMTDFGPRFLPRTAKRQADFGDAEEEVEKEPKWLDLGVDGVEGQTGGDGGGGGGRRGGRFREDDLRNSLTAVGGSWMNSF
jgi:hypothetical protein